MKKAFLTLSFLAAVTFAIADNLGNHANKEKASETAIASKSLAISGRVIDLASGEALAGVEVCLEGTSQKAHTDFDGNFKIENVKPGSYNLIASYISYNSSLIEKYDIDKNNQELNIKLQSAN